MLHLGDALWRGGYKASMAINAWLGAEDIQDPLADSAIHAQANPKPLKRSMP